MLTTRRQKNDIDNFVDIMFLHDGETADQPDQPEKHEARTARHNL